MSDALSMADGPFGWTCATHHRPASPLSFVARDVVLRMGQATVLEGVTLRLGAVGCTVVLGANGAGKTMLLKLMHGLLKPNAGHLSWDGQPPDTVMSRQAFVFQKPVLLRRSVAANVAFILKTRGKDPSRVTALLEHVGLADKAAQPARMLSGGEAQRLAIGCALATDPKVLFLDEPTASLDPGATSTIEHLVQAACDRGVRVIFVTHDIAQARRLAGDVVFLHKGRVAEHRQASDFFGAPHTSEARDFLAGRHLGC